MLAITSFQNFHSHTSYVVKLLAVQHQTENISDILFAHRSPLYLTDGASYDLYSCIQNKLKRPNSLLNLPLFLFGEVVME
jgi:hypothetical protein